LVEFILPSDINDEDALNLLEQVPNSQLENPSSSSAKIAQSTANRLVITEQGNTTRPEDKDPFLKKMSKYSPNPDEYRPVVVDRALLKAMDPSLVFVCKWPFPLRWKWYRIIVPEQPLGRCRHCNKFFHNDEFELALLEHGGCPFCRNKKDSDTTGEAFLFLLIFIIICLSL
jgi:intraflagellar transport protein 122